MDKKHIYIADDDDAIREAIKIFLENDGYVVTAFANGDALLAHFLQCECDLVILDVMMPGSDGFTVCRRLRGAGEMLGTRQSGLPLFRMADLATDGDLLQAARDDAQLVLNKDPRLTGPRGEALRVLLYLFERDEAIRLLSAG